MNPIIRNILAVIAGLVIGNLVNFGLIMIGPSVIPPPPGVNVMDMESLKTNMHLFEPKHFIFPFLSHALGTLAGALVVSFLAATHKMKFAIGVGVIFLLGGIVASISIPAPTWFIALDLIVAYIPMGWLGGKLTESRIQK